MDLSLELSIEQDSGIETTVHLALIICCHSEHREKRCTYKLLYKLSRHNKLLDTTPTTYLHILFM